MCVDTLGISNGHHFSKTMKSLYLTTNKLKRVKNNEITLKQTKIWKNGKCQSDWLQLTSVLALVFCHSKTNKGNANLIWGSENCEHEHQ